MIRSEGPVDLSDLVELENDETPEMVPDIVPVDARLSITGDALSLGKLFSRATSVTPEREVLPGTGYALLEAFQAEGSSTAYVRITATDGKQSIAVLLDGPRVRMPGRVLLPPKRVHDILKLAPKKEVSLEVIGDTLTIRSGRAVWEVQAPLKDQLPELPDVRNIPLEVVEASVMRRALDVVGRAVATSTARAALMQVHIGDGKMTACDGARFHRMEIADFPKDVEMLLPYKVIAELISAMDKHPNDANFELGGNDYHLVFKIGSDIIIVQQLLLPFPDVGSILLAPAIKNNDSLTVAREDLEESIKRIRVNSDPDYAAIFLTTTQNGKDAEGKPVWNLTVHARDRRGNTSQETLDCQWTGRKSVNVCVNHKQFLELITYTSDEFLTVRLGDSTRQALTKVLISDTPAGFTGVLTQMNPSYV